LRLDPLGIAPPFGPAASCASPIPGGASDAIRR